MSTLERKGQKRSKNATETEEKDLPAFKTVYTEICTVWLDGSACVLLVRKKSETQLFLSGRCSPQSAQRTYACNPASQRTMKKRISEAHTCCGVVGTRVVAIFFWSKEEGNGKFKVGNVDDAALVARQTALVSRRCQARLVLASGSLRRRHLDAASARARVQKRRRIRQSEAIPAQRL
jgi:hypothetical protein